MIRYSPFCFLLLVALHADESTSAASAANSNSPVVLEPVVVRDKLDQAREDIVPSLGAAEFRLDRTQIDSLPLGSNAGFNEVLLRVPGVAQDSFGQVHLRGEHADLQYRINDVLLPEGLSGFGQELDTRFIDSAAVLTGALPAQYGYRTAGVVDIHTRAAVRNGGEVTLYGGSFGTERANLEATGVKDRLNGYVTASAERSDLGVENPTSARTAIHDHKDEHKAFGYVSGIIDETSRVAAMVSVSFARFEIPNNPDQTPSFSVRGATALSSAELDERQREENHYAVLAYQKTSGDFSGQVSAFGRYSLVAFTPDLMGDLLYNGVASRVRRALTGTGLESDAKWSFDPTHTLRVGTLVSSTNAGTRALTTVLPTDVDGIPSSDVPFAVGDDHRKLGWIGGIYAQDEWKPAAHWTLNYGLRADTAHAFRNEGQLSPRVNGVYQISDAVTLHVGYARYFTPPPVELVQGSSITKFAGTTNAAAITTSSPVRAERAHYFDLGLTTKLAAGLSVTLDAYDKRTKDVLDEGQFGQALIFSPFNYRQGETYGAELSANYTRAGFSTYVNLALSRSTAREIVSGEFQFDPDELDYIATHDVHVDHDQRLTASAGASYRWDRTLVYLDALYGSGLRRGFANQDHLPEYSPVNLGIEHTLALVRNRELRLRLDVVNIFDAVYALRDGSGIGVGAPQYGMRRGLFGGATLAF